MKMVSSKECSAETSIIHLRKRFGRDFNQTNASMEMAKYILQILKSRIFIIMSWGFHHPVAIENGLRFNVNGFIHQGKVEVIYNASSDLFEVRLLNTDGTIKEQTSDVYLDCLVNVIDGMVERCPDYKERVKDEYGI